MIASNIHAGNLWAVSRRNRADFSQVLPIVESDILLQVIRSLPVEAVTRKRIQEYNDTVARYESEPDKAEGKKELAARAKEFEAQRERAMKQDTSFDFAEALFQIAIVLASVAILSYIRLILRFAIVLGIVATALMLNGFFLLVPLPF